MISCDEHDYTYETDDNAGNEPRDGMEERPEAWTQSCHKNGRLLGESLTQDSGTETLHIFDIVSE